MIGPTLLILFYNKLGLWDLVDKSDRESTSNQLNCLCPGKVPE